MNMLYFPFTKTEKKSPSRNTGIQEITMMRVFAVERLVVNSQLGDNNSNNNYNNNKRKQS